MDSRERVESINALQAAAEDLSSSINRIRALALRNETRGLYQHLTEQLEVPAGEEPNPAYISPEETPDEPETLPVTRTLDPEADRDYKLPGSRYTLGEVLDWMYCLAELAAYVEAEPGQPFQSTGLLRRMYGFASPGSIT